jgi:hypothetical protein
VRQAVPIIRIENPGVFVGMDLAKARIEIGEHGYESRVVNEDGQRTTAHFDLKRDYDPLRINLWVEKGKVTKAVIG